MIDIADHLDRIAEILSGCKPGTLAHDALCFMRSTEGAIDAACFDARADGGAHALVLIATVFELVRAESHARAQAKHVASTNRRMSQMLADFEAGSVRCVECHAPDGQHKFSCGKATAKGLRLTLKRARGTFTFGIGDRCVFCDGTMRATERYGETKCDKCGEIESGG